MSALRQQCVIEVIVVDDASSDQTATVARQLASTDARVRLFQQAFNRGPGPARNSGVEQASGHYIGFLDADDELLGNFADAACQMFQDNPQLMTVKCEMEFFDPVKGYILPAADPRHVAATLSSSCGMLMLRDCFLRMGGFPDDPVFRGPAGGEDVAFMQAVMAHFQPMGRMDGAGYRVWSRSGSHLDRFLAATRLTDMNSFEFLMEPSFLPTADTVKNAIDQYLETIQLKLCRHVHE